MQGRMTTYTIGPWAQGTLLDTNDNRALADAARQKLQAIERRSVFANFNLADAGRTRQLIGVFTTPEDAALASAAPDLLHALQAVAGGPYDIPEPLLERIRAAIRKATPAPRPATKL